ncbi:MAG: glycosyltransferase family 2 protein [Nitrospirae bacterium]|nr:glycosyltransferase family 2 protein [Nitrospirota bacterium]MBF0535512.1 glycosyltransferase family 2 protein [Nitrospirota bacterium]MBF0617356.1 glycosyltransferase family 2 protein [Nitrospirota bacterium]
MALTHMDVSVIIPTINAAGSIRKVAASCFNQKYEDGTPISTEVIVIDSSSSDNTVEIARALGCKTIIIPVSEFNHGDTRNRAASIASGRVLMFMTQDALPVNDTLFAAILKPLTDPLTAAAFARQIPKKNANPVECFSRTFNYPDIGMVKSKDVIGLLGIKTFFFSNVCSAIKREAFTEAGGFPSVIMNEDMMMSSKLIFSGYNVVYEPSALVYHSHNFSLMQQLKRHFDIGVSLKENNLLNYVRPDGEGLRYFMTGLRHFLNDDTQLPTHKLLWLIYFILQTIFRFIGYTAGTHYEKISKPLRKHLSGHPSYFK